MSYGSSNLGPENVLVIYNADSVEGQQVAGYYADVRGIPENQVVGVANIGLGQEITADTYLDVLRPQVLAALTPSIDVIVTTKGMPLRVINYPDPTTSGSPFLYVDPFGVQRFVFPAMGNPAHGTADWSLYSSLESELAQIDKVSMWEQMGDQSWWIPQGSPWYPHHSRNLYYDTQEAFDHETYGSRLTCRLDGFSVSDVTASIDRAQQAFVGPHCCFVVDNQPDSDSINTMESLANDVLDQAGMSYTYDNTNSFLTDAPSQVLGYVSHGTHGGGKCAPNDYLVDGGLDGQLAFSLADGAIFHTHESFNAYCFQEGGNCGGQGLIAEWIARGGTAGVGHVQEPTDSVATVTNEDIMFEMLLDGYTWAEAAWCATQQLSFVNTVVGDPLMVFRELVTGDANKDGVVDIADLLALGYHWQEEGESGGAMWEQGDFNGDGSINVADLLALGYNWGASAEWYEGNGAGEMPSNLYAFISIPEPSSFFSSLMVLLVVLGYRRRPNSPSVRNPS